jgi:hypothetical protein
LYLFSSLLSRLQIFKALPILKPEKCSYDFQKAMDDIFPEWNVTEGETMAACTYSLMDAKIIRKLMTSFLKDAEDGMIKFNVGEFADNLVSLLADCLTQ